MHDVSRCAVVSQDSDCGLLVYNWCSLVSGYRYLGRIYCFYLLSRSKSHWKSRRYIKMGEETGHKEQEWPHGAREGREMGQVELPTFKRASSLGQEPEKVANRPCSGHRRKTNINHLHSHGYIEAKSTYSSLQ
jgi:hypothetical protein